jgi:DNA (cytosine-5)-methyltransferase 1
MNSSLNAISLFSGCGGDTLGLTRAGFHVGAFNEFNKAAIQTHEANFPNSVLLKDPTSNATDISKVSDSVFEPYKGTTNIVFAGFPCQGFSKAGKKKATDPRNQMFRQFVRVAKVTKPDFVIGENVTGLTTMKSGPNEADPLVLDIIKKAFQEIGYEMTHKVVEATEFGVPQKRKRILLIGWDVARYPTFDPSSFWASVSNWGAQQQIPLLRSFVKPVLSGAYELKADEVPEDFDLYCLPTSDEPSGTPHPFVVLKAGEKLLSCSKRVSPVHSEVIDLDKPSKTIICTYDHQPRLLVGLKHSDGRRFVRTLLPEELQQIQGFPSDYIIVGNTKEEVVQIGNAVPPNLVHGVATILKSYFEPVFETVSVEVKKRVVKKKSTKP